MRRNARMDRVLEQADQDPSHLDKMLPVFQTFVRYGDVKPYLHYLESIKLICQKWDQETALALEVSYLAEAYVFFCLGQYAETEDKITQLRKQRELAAGSEHYASAELMLGVCTRDKGDIDTALVHFLNVIGSREEGATMPNIKAIALYLLAELHMQIGETEAAGKYYRKALKMARKIGHEISIFRSLIGLGAWYQQRGNYKKSIRLFKRALDMETMTGAARARVLRDLGSHYFAVGKYAKAIDYLERSYRLAMEQELPSPASTCLIKLGEIHLTLKAPEKAVAVLREALAVSHRFNTRAKQLEIETLLAEAYRELQDYEKAFIHAHSARQLSETIHTEKQTEIFKIKNRIILEQKKEIEKERKRSDRLLLNILPATIAAELKEHRSVKPQRYGNVSVLFSDFVGFTTISEALSSRELVDNLDTYFRAFDKIVAGYGLEKIKTIGDAYMCAGGLPEPSPTHARDIVLAGLDMQAYVQARLDDPGVAAKDKWPLRIGIHAGPVIAGVVGDSKFAYDIWGNTVNVAARMESSGAPGKVNVSRDTRLLLAENSDFTFVSRGQIVAKSLGAVEMFFVERKEDAGSESGYSK